MLAEYQALNKEKLLSQFEKTETENKKQVLSEIERKKLEEERELKRRQILEWKELKSDEKRTREIEKQKRSNSSCGITRHKMSDKQLQKLERYKAQKEILKQKQKEELMNEQNKVLFSKEE